jgi:hypothetical protein
MNKSRKLGWQCHSIEKCIEVIMGLLGCTRDEAFEYARTRTRTRVNILTSTIKKDTSLEINKQVNTNGREGVYRADATARAPGFSLGYLLRNKPSAIPEYFAIWWYKSMKDRDWALAKGGHVTAANMRVHLCTWYKHIDINETQEAHALYAKWKDIFRAQEMFAAEEWDSTCRDCDNFANGHCMACALRPPKSAALCKRFISNPTHL